MDLTFHPSGKYDNATLAAWFNDAFAGYLAGEPDMAGDALAAFLHVNHVDARLSQVALAGGDFAGLSFVSAFEGRSRLAAMGVAAGARGKGVGDRLMRRLLEASSERGDRQYTLEVIEQNDPAVALYRKHGFRVVRRLCGWRMDRPVAMRGVVLVAAGGAELCAAAATASAQDLPWQIALPNLQRLVDDAIVYRHGRTFVAASHAADGDMILETVLTEGHELNVQEAIDCLHGVFSQHPDRTWVVPVRFPESYGVVFELFAAQRQDFTQLQMARDL